MNAQSILLVPVGGGEELASALAPALAGAIAAECRVSPHAIDAAGAFDSSRGQYRSDALLNALGAAFPRDWRVLGVTPLDLFVPVLTFVFGEAQLGGRCAIVSAHRLREEVYGLPPDDDLTMDRLLKEAVHELGHTFSLRHCDDWTCVMRSGHAVEQVDLKTAQFCERCRARLSLA